jgi:DNA (cytosine-5)-methyltransferase 1
MTKTKTNNNYTHNTQSLEGYNMNVLSLFSGVGGFDLGLENAGMKTIYQCEWDKHATGVLELHWPHVPRWGDITTLTGKEILSHGTPPDVVAWGSPCQDLSVAGKRAGLEGERSGLFHEGIRIINELRKETNNEYPKISIWENVAGALSSNRGADFGVILDEMAKAGAMVIEWALLDAQHFGIPQRRRRVFCIAIFNSATATNCPSPLLPVSESLPRDITKGKPKRKSAASEVADSIGDSRILGSDIVGSRNTSDAKMISTQYVNENKVVVEPYVKSRRAQSATDDETWVPGQINPTLNSFDVGDTRATTAIVQEPMLVDGTRVDDVRVYEPPVQTLGARMGTGGNNVPMLAFDTQFGSNANVFEDQSPRAGTKQSTGVLMFQDSEFGVKEYDTAGTLRAGRIPEHQMIGEVAATLPSGGDGGVPSSRGEHLDAEPTMAVRRLTPLECERLMG